MKMLHRAKAAHAPQDGFHPRSLLGIARVQGISRFPRVVRGWENHLGNSSFPQDTAGCTRKQLPPQACLGIGTLWAGLASSKDQRSVQTRVGPPALLFELCKNNLFLVCENGLGPECLKLILSNPA